MHRGHMWDASRHNPSEDALKNKHSTWKKGSEMGKPGGIFMAKKPAVCIMCLSLQKRFEDERDPSGFLSRPSGLGLLQTCLQFSRRSCPPFWLSKPCMQTSAEITIEKFP